MKNIIIQTGIFFLLALGQTSMAQTNCDELKKENESLKKALQITTPVKTITSSKIDFNFIKCEGNAKEQTVEITLTLVDHDANRSFQFHRTKAIDIEANEYETSDVKVGGATSGNTIYTDTPVKAVIKCTKILPSIKMLKLIPLSYFNGAPGNSIEIEFRDIAITWK